eukprot:scaffold4829_cov129-Cylindrotheca_fusiformis.AAC.20
MTAKSNCVSFSGVPPQSPASRFNRKRPLKRLVSEDELHTNNKVSPEPSGSMVLTRRVSECDKSIAPPGINDDGSNPLNTPSKLKTHLLALRLEADLYPMRLILSRLMSHPQCNKKGLFNHPVDAEALGLKDYHLHVTKPMDLGTVKSRLHGLAYKSRENVAEDIRLVFQNAMKYNPPQHPVHKFANELLAMFNEYYRTLPPCVAEDSEQYASSLNVQRPQPLISKSESGSGTPSGKHLCSPVPEQVTAEVGSSSVAFSRPMALYDRPSAPPVPKRRSSSMFLTYSGPHSCDSCLGRTCVMCKQGCLKQEPYLLICQGRNCSGAKIRKGSIYYIAEDGSRHYCERCFTSLPPVLSQPSGGDAPLYKQDLLKRKNNEEIVEDWITCITCEAGVHAVCAMYNSYVHGAAGYECPDCRIPNLSSQPTNVGQEDGLEDTFTFLSGRATPVPISTVGPGSGGVCSESLEECSISSFIQQKVRNCIKSIPNADKTVNVRVISDCSRHFSVPEVIRKHFRMATESDGFVKPPRKVTYRQKAIAMFQKMDGLDVCVFCMYVQEYDGDDLYDCNEIGSVNASHSKRVYIAYIDSVEYFRPRELRTQVYHEILVSYLATARERGYETAQIWACPPSRGNSFVFWNHPASQRTPTIERLISWYHDALSRSVDCGVVTDIKSLFESEFEQTLQDRNRTTCGRVLCPPLLEGDFWIEEAVRLHDANILRNLKIRSPTEVCVWHVTPLTLQDLDPCPAMQVATLIKDRVMTHPSSVSFRRPVNAAAMKLKDYHKVVTEPMDLGTIYSRCVIGEYQVLQEVVEDVRLMVSNARKFNPAGHFVHEKAGEVLELFFQELGFLARIWSTIKRRDPESWETYADMSMNLDLSLQMPKQSDNKSASVVIEDDRSSDGSRSTTSSLSAQASPTQPMETEATPISSQTPVPSTPKVVPRSTGRGRKKKSSMNRKLELLEDGSEAIMQSMIGGDLWLMDKRLSTPAKGSAKKTRKRRRSALESEDQAPKKRNQSWLGEDLAESVRRLRTSLFTCSLVPKEAMTEKEVTKFHAYREYVRDFKFDSDSSVLKSSPITETRHGFLELSQFRRFEFNTLRRAKYSTSMLIYHLRNEDAQGVIPVCTSCKEDIHNVLWHKVQTVAEKVIGPKAIPSPRPSSPQCVGGELCESCHQQQRKVEQEQYIPIPVSLKKPNSTLSN